MAGSHSAWGGMIAESQREARERAEYAEAFAHHSEATYDPDNPPYDTIAEQTGEDA